MATSSSVAQKKSSIMGEAVLRKKQRIVDARNLAQQQTLPATETHHSPDTRPIEEAQPVAGTHHDEDVIRVVSAPNPSTGTHQGEDEIRAVSAGKSSISTAKEQEQPQYHHESQNLQRSPFVYQFDTAVGIDPDHPRNPPKPKPGKFAALKKKLGQKAEQQGEQQEEQQEADPATISPNMRQLLPRPCWEVYICYQGLSRPAWDIAEGSSSTASIRPKSRFKQLFQLKKKGPSTTPHTWLQTLRIQVSDVDRLVDYIFDGIEWFIHPDPDTPDVYRSFEPRETSIRERGWVKNMVERVISYRDPGPVGGAGPRWAAEITSSGRLRETLERVDVRERAARENATRLALYDPSGTMCMWTNYTWQVYWVFNEDMLDFETATEVARKILDIAGEGLGEQWHHP